MKRFREGFIGPIVILFIICAVVSGAVAATYAVTNALILERQEAQAAKARSAVLPGADAFTRIDAELPDGVLEAHTADNGAGYTFKAQAGGFNGPVVFMIGIDARGNIAGIDMIEHDETPGQGSLVGEASYLERFVGRDDPQGMDAVSGATVTSNALKTALELALEAYVRLA